MDFTLGPSCTYRRALVSDIGIIPTHLDNKLPTGAIKRLEHHPLIPFQGSSYAWSGWFHYQSKWAVQINEPSNFEAIYLNYIDKLNKVGYTIPKDPSVLNALLQGQTVCLYICRHLVLREYIELVPISSSEVIFPDMSRCGDGKIRY